ncbi:MAG: hypothetical protein L6R38_004881 [Xanthoria sp. 2 TBL-2021]|nr:MAG: hypothetical protein L6R38_004881 [Xanthoria sp. 2 TBL-2021]
MVADSFRASKTFTTLVVSFAIFTDILIQNLVVPVLPYALHTRVGLDNNDDIQRWTSILLAAFGAVLMIGCLFFGYVADLLPSRRTLFILGLVLLFLSTLFFALATSVWALLAARILQGLSTAIVHTVGYTLLTEVVGKEHLGKAMGYTSMALSSGLLIGPVLGGVLYEYCGFFQVFLPAFGLITIEAMLRCMVVEKEKKKPAPLISPSSQLPTAPPGASQTHAAAQHPLSTESDPLLSHPPQSTARHAGVYKALLTSPRFVVALTSLFVLNSIANGFDSTLVPFVQDAFNMRASRVPALFLALAIPMLLAPLSGWLADHHGPRFPILAGIAVAIPALILLSLISQATTTPLLKMVMILAFVGLSFALAMGPLGVHAILAVHEIEEQSAPDEFGANGILARAIGLQNTIIAGGGLLGPLYAGFVRVAVGWKGLELLNAGLCAGILILALLSVDRRRVGGRQSEETAV